MAFFAGGVDHETSVKIQAEMAEQRRIGAITKQIGELQSAMMSAVETWLRHRAHPKGHKAAQQAWDRAIQFRRDEMALWRELLGLNARLAIEDKRG
jgi:hypothetical protein